MLMIRLARGGAKKRPYHRIVVAEKASSRDGRFVELIGFSNPMASGAEPRMRLNATRYQHWLEKGAKPTDAVKRLARIHNRADTSAESTDSAKSANPDKPAKPDKPTAADVANPATSTASA